MNTIEKLKEAKARLLKSVETIDRQIDALEHNKPTPGLKVSSPPCKHMTATAEPLRKNYPCKGNKITCDHPDVDEITASIMSTKKCKPENCRFYEEG